MKWSKKIEIIILLVSSFYIGDIAIAGKGLMVIVLGVFGVISMLELLLAQKAGMYSSAMSKIIDPSILIVICIFIAIILNMWNMENLSGAITRMISIICSISICGSIAIHIRKFDDVKFIGDLFVLFTTISSMVVIGQYFNFGWAWSLARETADTIEAFVGSQRYSGLSSSVIVFAYQVSATMAYLLMVGKKRFKSFIWIILLFVNGTALIFNRTRSAIISVAVILVLVLLWSEQRKSFKILEIIGIVLGVLLVAYGDLAVGMLTNNVAFIVRSEESSGSGTLARLPMFLTAFNHAIRYPFGMGEYHAHYNLIVGTNSERVKNYVMTLGCHNLFANCIANYGIVAFFALINIYKRVIGLYKYNSNKLNQENSFNSIYAEVGRENKAIIAVLIVSVINACFHNAYLLAEDFTSWIFLGVLIGLTQLISYDRI